MSYRSNFNYKGGPFSAIFGVLVLVLAFVAFFYISQLVIKILYGAITPIILIITLILDYKVITNYFKWLIDLTKRNLVMGLGTMLLTVIGYPFVVLFLFGKALLRRKVRKMREEAETQRPGEYIEYEEVDDENTLELPQVEERKKEPEEEQRLRRDQGTDYEQLFD